MSSCLTCAKPVRASVVDSLSHFVVEPLPLSSFGYKDGLFCKLKLCVCWCSRAVFVWSGKGDPFFTPEGGDPLIAKRIMRFLCLVADWERENLADSIFSALGVRVVDALHG